MATNKNKKATQRSTQWVARGNARRPITHNVHSLFISKSFWRITIFSFEKPTFKGEMSIVSFCKSKNTTFIFILLHELSEHALHACWSHSLTTKKHKNRYWYGRTSWKDSASRIWSGLPHVYAFGDKQSVSHAYHILIIPPVYSIFDARARHQ